jgi:hypothetical protein
MECEEIRSHFPDYLIDDLPAGVSANVEHHLTTCESCCREIEDLKTTWTKIGAIPVAVPGPAVRRRFQVMLEAYEQGRRRRVLQIAFAMGLLVMGIVIGHQFQLAQSPQSNSEIVELRGELREMRQMVALSLLQQQSASERLKGVNWSYQLQQPGSEVLTALLDTLMHDSNVNVRLAAIDALRQFGTQQVVRNGVVEALTRQDSPMVQMALIDLVVDWREKESVNTLRILSQNQNLNEAVRERAQDGLTQLQ